MGSTEGSAGGPRDFFISHARRDHAWAEWLGWQLTEAGYGVELDVWDWAPGHDFVAQMRRALGRAERMLAVYTPAYFAGPYTERELHAAFTLGEGRIVPVLVEPCDIPELFRPLIHIDLVGLDEEAAAERLSGGVVVAGGRPTRPPPFPPAAEKPAFAGQMPDIWNVPQRNPHFTGRTELLDEQRLGPQQATQAGARPDQRLRSGEQSLVVQALYGLGGVGKTQLAIEYAHRFAADYQLVWWIDAEQPALLATQLAALADPLGLPAGPAAEVVSLVLAELRSRPGWLLIFDNAERPQDIADYRPGGSGHVLVTSRQPGWGVLGGRLEVDVLTRPETIALLRRRLPSLDERLADQLADQLGDLPLAAAQAAAYLEQTGLAPAAYLHRFRTRQASLLAKGEVLGYHGRLDTTWALSEHCRHIVEPDRATLLWVVFLTFSLAQLGEAARGPGLGARHRGALPRGARARPFRQLDGGGRPRSCPGPARRGRGPGPGARHRGALPPGTRARPFRQLDGGGRPRPCPGPARRGRGGPRPGAGDVGP